MDKRFKVVAAVVMAVMLLAAFSVSAVSAQQNSKATWNPTVTQDYISPCGNVLCTGDCDSSCNGSCAGGGYTGNGSGSCH
jgi:curli biogenesis system outer membrane secretion channel CsgG